MNKGSILTSLIVAGLLTGCLDQTGQSGKNGSGPLFRSHYAGRAAFNQGTNVTRFRAVEALPITAELRADIVRKLARATFDLWRDRLPAGATEQSALLQPLIDELMVAESCVEIRGAAGKTRTSIAVELSDERARSWSTNLWQVAGAWKFGAPRSTTFDGSKGWEAKRSEPPGTLQFVRAGKWVLVGLGQSQPESIAEMLRMIGRSGRPLPVLTNGFWDVQADLPGLGAWFPVLAQFPLAPAHMSVMGRGENLRTELRLEYPGKISWTLEPWRLPTNFVSEPLTSFTVARGIAPLLERVRNFQTLNLKPTPNQITAWGISNEQSRIYFAVPVASSTNAMMQMAPAAPQFLLDRFPRAVGDMLYASNRHELVWSGLPWILPNLRTGGRAGSEFLIGGIFPLAGRVYPPPDELYAQVRGRSDLVYYDWEETPQRLDHNRQLYQLASLVDRRVMSTTNTAAQRWLLAIRPKLGNTVTEATQTGPREVTLIRKSQVGLTGFELATFAAWVDSPGFPFRLQLPPPLDERRTNAPARVKKP